MLRLLPTYCSHKSPCCGRAPLIYDSPVDASLRCCVLMGVSAEVFLIHSVIFSPSLSLFSSSSFPITVLCVIVLSHLILSRGHAVYLTLHLVYDYYIFFYYHVFIISARTKHGIHPDCLFSPETSKDEHPTQLPVINTQGMSSGDFEPSSPTNTTTKKLR